MNHYLLSFYDKYLITRAYGAIAPKPLGCALGTANIIGICITLRRKEGRKDEHCTLYVRFPGVLENMSVPETLGDGVKRVEPSPGMFPASLKLIG